MNKLSQMEMQEAWLLVKDKTERRCENGRSKHNKKLVWESHGSDSCHTLYTTQYSTVSLRQATVQAMYSPLADNFLVLIILAAYSWPVEIFMHRLTTEKAPLEEGQTSVLVVNTLFHLE